MHPVKKVVMIRIKVSRQKMGLRIVWVSEDFDITRIRSLGSTKTVKMQSKNCVSN